jgi:hypothetical protein
MGACPPIRVRPMRSLPHWMHRARTGKYTLITCHPKRGRASIGDADVLTRFHGIAVHNAWAPYDTHLAPAHRLCCAHARRELQGVVDTGGAGMSFTVQGLCRTGFLSTLRDKFWPAGVPTVRGRANSRRRSANRTPEGPVRAAGGAIPSEPVRRPPSTQHLARQRQTSSTQMLSGSRCNEPGILPKIGVEGGARRSPHSSERYRVAGRARASCARSAASTSQRTSARSTGRSSRNSRLPPSGKVQKFKLRERVGLVSDAHTTALAADGGGTF